MMALAERNIAAELVVLDFAKGDHKQPAHVARQPFAKMPAIEHEGRTLFESRAIARWIGEGFPGDSFVPTDAWQRALVDQWVNAEITEFFPASHPLVLELVFKRAFGGGEPDPAVVENLRVKLATTLGVLDRALEGKQYLVGEKFSLADMVYMPDLEYLHVGGEGPRIAKFANVARWWNTISARPSWAKAKAPAQPG
jgi:glutathione S-transferase